MTDERHQSHGIKIASASMGTSSRGSKKKLNRGHAKVCNYQTGEEKKYRMSNLPLPPITMQQERLITAPFSE